MMRAESSAASAALECFRLNAAADLLKRAVVVAADADLPGEIENDLNAAYRRVAPDDAPLGAAFKLHLASGVAG